MRIEDVAFCTTDWDKVPISEHAGETLQSIGLVQLRDIAEKQEVFTID